MCHQKNATPGVSYNKWHNMNRAEIERNKQKISFGKKAACGYF